MNSSTAWRVSGLSAISLITASGRLMCWAPACQDFHCFTGRLDAGCHAWQRLPCSTIAILPTTSAGAGEARDAVDERDYKTGAPRRPGRPRRGENGSDCHDTLTADFLGKLQASHGAGDFDAQVGGRTAEDLVFLAHFIEGFGDQLVKNCPGQQRADVLQGFIEIGIPGDCQQLRVGGGARTNPRFAAYAHRPVWRSQDKAT